MAEVGKMIERSRWSADGTRIAFTAIGADDITLQVVDSDGRNLASLKSYGGDDKIFDLHWMADGKRLLYEHEGPWPPKREEDQPSLVVFDVAVRKAGLFVAPKGGAGRAAVAPDGQHVAYVNGNSLFVVDLDGKNAHVVATGLIDQTSIAWGPAGK